MSIKDKLKEFSFQGEPLGTQSQEDVYFATATPYSHPGAIWLKQRKPESLAG
jgi:hypothetical protein